MELHAARMVGQENIRLVCNCVSYDVGTQQPWEGARSRTLVRAKKGTLLELPYIIEITPYFIFTKWMPFSQDVPIEVDTVVEQPRQKSYRIKRTFTRQL